MDGLSSTVMYQYWLINCDKYILIYTTKGGELSVRYMETLWITFTIFLYIDNCANVKKFIKN